MNPLPTPWRKSSHSNSFANCVEVSDRGGAVLVRDSKDACGPVLRCTPGEWSAFTTGIRAGEFDE
jgi:hypothetical protein